MKSFLRFDKAGRIIGKQRRTSDQLPVVAVDGAGEAEPYPDFIGDEVSAADFIKYKDHKKWWRDAGQIKARTKITLPLPARQRLNAQPAILWERIPGDQATLPWVAGANVAVGDAISIKPHLAYQAQKAGVTNTVPPAWGADVVWDVMPSVTWLKTNKPLETLAPPWQSLSIYTAGEEIKEAGAIWAAEAPGVSNKMRPAFATAVDTGEPLIDRDELSIPLPDLGGHPVMLKIAGELIELTERIDVFKPEAGRIAIELDSPGFYSDPYIILVETPD
ncbi:MAG: hypothetical protein AB9Q17_02360 [Candidatus Reddybacter sp.]